jgi:hypothetical protein
VKSLEKISTVVLPYEIHEMKKGISPRDFFASSPTCDVSPRLQVALAYAESSVTQRSIPPEIFQITSTSTRYILCTHSLRQVCEHFNYSSLLDSAYAHNNSPSTLLLNFMTETSSLACALLAWPSTTHFHF